MQDLLTDAPGLFLTQVVDQDTNVCVLGCLFNFVALRLFPDISLVQTHTQTAATAAAKDKKEISTVDSEPGVTLMTTELCVDDTMLVVSDTAVLHTRGIPQHKGFEGLQ